ncbi:Glycosyltransferase Family 1 protein [Gigaspora rosea]|uniref:Glycosyltransferase Family 1 protein n=1 Tax=Gigaspora rosea TaxID=44941 RepID=A0A397VY23_9GLOM|nr:Glycosyltransferase Family 1 protein [Gigaspora rosea]
MLPKNLFSLLWNFVIFITFFINQSFGSADLIKRDLSLSRSNEPKNILATSIFGGKPVVGISTDLYELTSSPYKSNPIFGCHVNMENESFYGRFKCAIINPLIKTLALREPLKGLNAKRASVGIDQHWDFLGRVSNRLMLSNNFYGFEIPSSESPLHQNIGPVIPDTFPGLTPILDSFLNAHPRTIYFALGTNAIISPQNLANSSSQITCILNNEYPHIHISKFSPQLAILSHVNTKLFLSHGGAGSSHESMYTATPMLVLPIFGDQPRNAELLESAGIALSISRANLQVDDIVSKVKRLLNEESFKKNAERLQFLAKINSKRKYRAADLIEIVMNTAKYQGVKDENGGFKVDNENLLRDWITPDTRMGFIRGKYLDVYGAAVIIFLVLLGGFTYTLWKISYFYITFRKENRDSQKSLNLKKKRK